VPELGTHVALKAALRHDTIRRAIEVDGWVSIADLKYRLDVGSSTTELAKALSPELVRVVVITNSLNIAEAEIKQAMVRSAEKIVFLAEHNKIGTVASAFVGDISCADLLVTDTGADPSALANLRAEGLKVVTADPGAG
jgi:DeoR/GlpR family transcriptional regulator of sugar metabolism